MTVDTASGRRRPRSPRGEGQRLRDDLIEAAIELMDHHGDVDAVTLRAIARQAGVSPTAVYRHFDDHLQLLQEAVTFCWSSFHDAIEAGARSAADPYESFRAAGDAYVAYAATTPGRYRVMFSNRIEVPGAPDGQGLVTFQILVDLVGAILRDRSDHRDPFLVAVQVHTWMHGIVDLCTSPSRGPRQRGGWPRVSDQLDGLQQPLDLGPRTA